MNLMKEEEIRNRFLEFLCNVLNYNQANFLIEKKINNKIIDLLIVQSTNDTIETLAFIEFKKEISNETLIIQQLLDQKKGISQDSIYSFVVTSNETFVLLNYGLQKINIDDFPKLEKLIRKF